MPQMHNFIPLHLKGLVFYVLIPLLVQHVTKMF